MKPLWNRPVARRLSLLLVVALVLLSGFLVIVWAQRPLLADPTVASAADDEKLRQGLERIATVYSLVEQNYAVPLDPNKALFDGAIPGMLRALDPHSTFFDPRAYADLEEEQTGRYYGVGMTIGARNGKIIVVSPTVGTPAFKAGVHPGDFIQAIDGQSTESMTTSDVAGKVRGPLGTTVRLTLLRPGDSTTRDVSLMRASIPRDSVSVAFNLKPGVGYIHISMFSETTVDELQKAFDALGPLQGLILDLRQDPGGLLEQAVGVADKFLPKGSVIVSQRGRASPEKVYNAAHGNGGKTYPIVVLVDRGTASAAEIVSGALQDHDRGLVAGENTFGKGLVQTVFSLSDKTGLALTTAKYYTPSGRLIQRNYEGVSLYNYFYRQPDPSRANVQREARTTDTGRTVYGGDGITPDVVLPSPKGNSFQDELLEQYVFFDYAQSYLAAHPITDLFQVDDAVLTDFRNFLHQRAVTYTEADLTANLDWVKSNLKAEIFSDKFGTKAGLKVHAQTDPAVLQAIELLPRAQALEQKAEQLAATQHPPRAAVTQR